MAPTIGITTYHTNADWRGWSEEGALLPWRYVTAVRKSGGRVVLLPPGGDATEAEETLAVLDGVVIAGDCGEVRGYAGNPLAAPPLPPGGLKAR